MRRAQREQVSTLYEKARAVPAAEQAWVLEAHCDDPAVREEVASLLDARAEAPAFFETLANKAVAPILDELSAERREADAAPDLTGQQVGPYRLVEEIGVGGMGIVYRARRADGRFEQTVAVKLLRRRLHPEEATARFQTERQVLASLDHPHIADLIDGGVVGGSAEEGGRPYLVMEHVDGTPITDYADQNDLDLDARLDLLGQVFDAVAAAHRQLVVHRDLKPSNVLVMETDEGRPQVKLLDFGIAKLLGESLPVTRPQTRTGMHLMTPAYAAPEQVSGSEVTTSTDVYQLGVLTYELLAGTRPFDLSGASASEAERIVLEEDPPVPSERSAERAVWQDAGGGIAASALRGDVDTIVLKALRKEPEQRYPSVEEMATDVERFRAGKPIAARRATLGYRAWKFVRRNRTVVGAGLLVVLLGIAYAVTVTVQAHRLTEQRNRARTEAQTAEQVSSYLVDLFRSSDPYEAPDTVTARTLLRRGARRVARLQGQPAVQAQMLEAMGRAHRGRANYATADSLLRRARTLQARLYDRPDPELATTVQHLGAVQISRGRYAAAESLSRNALEMRRQLHEPPHPRIAESLHYLALAKGEQGAPARADSLYRMALAMRRATTEEPGLKVASTLNNLGVSLMSQGKYAAADSLYRQALAIEQNHLEATHPTIATTLNNLGLVLDAQDKLAAADSVYRQALAIKRNHLETAHPSTATTLGNQAGTLEEMGRLAAADSLYRRGLAIEEARLSATHPHLVTTLRHLADVKKERGQYAAADSLYQEVIALQQKRAAVDSLERAETLNDWGIVLRESGDFSAADSAYRRALSIKRQQLGPRHPEVALTLNNRAIVLWEQGKYAAADSMYQKALAIRRAHYGLKHPRTATTMHNRAFTLMKQGRYAAADSLFRQALAIRRAALGAKHLHVSDTRRGLGLLARQQGRFQAAARHLEKALAIRRAKLRDDHPEVREVLRPLAELYDTWGKPQKAERYRVVEAKGSG
jgi:serine/threonine-protein kinase